MSCPPTDTLACLIDGELGETRAAEVRAHVEICGRCRSALDELTQLARDLRAPGPDALGVAPDAFADEVLSKLVHRQPARSRSGGAARTLRVVGLLAAAACLPLALGVGWHLTREHDGEFTARGAASSSSREDDPRGTLVRVGRMTGSAFEPILEGTRLSPDDVLVGEVGATEGAPRYLLAFIVDARGERHWLYPAYEVGMPPPSAMPLPSTMAPRVLGTMVRLDRPAAGAGKLVVIVLPRPESVTYIEGAPATELTRERLAAHHPGALVAVTNVVVESSR